MTCDRIIERLVDGARPAEDPELGAHLHSCLRCYRAAADLRELPALTDLLHEARPERGAGPDAEFWRSFPTAVSAAWVSGRAAAQTGPVAAARAASPVRRLRDWLRRPMPAAFAGAACAAAVAFVVVKPLRNPPVVTGENMPAAVGLPSSSSADDLAGTVEDSIARTAPEELPLSRSPGLDESVRDLDDVSLRVVLEGLDRELGAGVSEDPEVPSAADLATTSEALEDLDLQGLEALRERLGRSI